MERLCGGGAEPLPRCEARYVGLTGLDRAACQAPRAASAVSRPTCRRVAFAKTATNLAGTMIVAAWVGSCSPRRHRLRAPRASIDFSATARTGRTPVSVVCRARSRSSICRRGKYWRRSAYVWVSTIACFLYPFPRPAVTRVDSPNSGSDPRARRLKLSMVFTPARAQSRRDPYEMAEAAHLAVDRRCRPRGSAGLTPFVACRAWPN